VRSQARDPVIAVSVLALALAGAVSTRHRIILVAGLPDRAEQSWQWRTDRPRRAMDSTEGEKGPNPARRGHTYCTLPSSRQSSFRVIDGFQQAASGVRPGLRASAFLRAYDFLVRFRPIGERAFVGRRGLCHHLCMAKTVIVRLTDDMDGGDADETIDFALDGQSYEIDLSTANASKLRQAFKPYIEKGRSSRGRGVRARSPRPSGPPAKESLYSKLSGEEKARFRAWANMPTARRISDARVKSWSASGKP
jgi:hypothetical protein